MQVTYIFNDPKVNYCFMVILFPWEKVFSDEKFNHNLTLEVQVVWKITALQCYWWEYWNAEKDLNFQKLQLKWKVPKHFTNPKQWAASKTLFNLPPDKSFLGLWNEKVLTEICRNTDIWFSSASKIQFFGVKEWYNANVIRDAYGTEVWKVFGCVARVYILQCSVSWGL